MSSIADKTNRRASIRRSLIGLETHVPVSALAGDPISCEWRLTNQGDIAVAASFYVRTMPGRLIALECSSGRVVCGHFHGGSSVNIAARDFAAVLAVVEAPAAGEWRLRVAVVTNDAVLERTNIVTIDPPKSGDALRNRMFAFARLVRQTGGSVTQVVRKAGELQAREAAKVGHVHRVGALRTSLTPPLGRPYTHKPMSAPGLTETCSSRAT